MIDEPRPNGAESPPANDDEVATPGPGATEPQPGADVAQQEVAGLKDQLLRTLAELENTRRRARKEVEDASKYAIAGFARDCLSVADNLARALGSVPAETLASDESLKALHDGVGMTGRELASVFERHGIRRVDPLGERFDPNLHQAMLEMPSNDHPAGTVVQVLQAGYTIAGRLLRPALVAVAKAGDGAPGPDSPGSRVDTSA
jgi:molecular chaperone GrpE